jgi:hypothetical protein
MRIKVPVLTASIASSVIESAPDRKGLYLDLPAFTPVS